MTPTKKYLTWLDRHLLELVAGFLLAFIPLYPKWPLFDILPGYIVRARLDDLVVGTAFLLLLLQVARRKTRLGDNPLFKPILIYLLIGFLSTLSSIFITKTVPLELLHVGKVVLHWIRRVEYMSLALVFFAAATNKHSLKRILTVFVVTVTAVSLYGFGQRYLAWPVYSTMNREFAKGWRLVLTEFARVSSTFAGHYDLAAYTVLSLSFLAGLVATAATRLKWLIAFIFLLTFAILLLTASRSSFIAYIGSLTLLFLLLSRKIGTKKALVSWLLFMLVSAVGLRSFGSLYSRFAHILMLDRLEGYLTPLVDRFKPEPARNYQINNDLALVYTETDTPPSPAATSSTGLPPDVYENIPLTFPEASLSAVPDTSGTGTEGQSRTYSDAAYTYGLSSAIRFDALWPKAIAGFLKNPLLGSGYSTLLKDQPTQFTEAESTDNDYLRALGETGLLGFLSFYGIFVFILYLSYRSYQKLKDPVLLAFAAAFIAGLVGLMVNALYIDIFEASKIAYTVWSFMGLTAALFIITKKSSV